MAVLQTSRQDGDGHATCDIHPDMGNASNAVSSTARYLTRKGGLDHRRNEIGQMTCKLPNRTASSWRPVGAFGGACMCSIRKIHKDMYNTQLRYLREVQVRLYVR
jgi:hypothetical protein